ISLDKPQQNAFLAMVIAYNAIVYPLAVAAAVVIFRRVAKRLPEMPRASGPTIDELRRRVRRLGWQSALIGALGWFPGGLLFPLVIDLAAGPFEHPGQVYAH